MGNICRSPAGEGVMKHLVAEAGLQNAYTVESAGTISFHSGSRADARMRAAAAQRGIELTSIAQQIKPKDLETYDLILTMDEENYRNVRALKGADVYADKIQRFCDYCMEHADKEVPDPYYGGDQGFEHVLDLLEDGCRQVLEQTRKKLDA